MDQGTVYRFGEFALDMARVELRRGGAVVHLRPKVFGLLAYLVEHRERAVSKDELLERVWDGQAMGDAVLTSSVRQARQAVSDDGVAQRLIRTVRGCGYRFVGQVELGDRDADGAGPATGGESLAASGPGLVGSPLASSSGERKTVSVLSCALVPVEGAEGEPLAEETHRLRVAFASLVREITEDLQGTVLQRLDGSVMALFGVPVAHEDHANRAVLAANRLKQRLAQGGSLGGAGAALRPAMGLHCGAVFAGASEGDAQLTVTAESDALGLADQLRGLALPGTILLSAAAQRAIDTRVETRPTSRPSAPPGTVELLEGALAAPGRSALTLEGRALTRFLGRGHERRTLDMLWDRVCAGRGQVVGVVGDPGVGKSRLLLEFSNACQQRGAPLLVTHCVSYGGRTPYLPLEPLVRQACELASGERAVAAAAEVQRRMGSLGLSDPEAESPQTPAEVAELSPQALKARTFEALTRLFVELAETQPVVVVIEDLHWVDATSGEWLEQLVRRMAAVPLLLLLSYRPGYRMPAIERSYGTQLTLSALDADDSAALVREVLGEAHAQPAVLQSILQRAEGNPFFLQELAWAVREQGVESVERGVPGTLQATLAARIDRLSAHAKHVLQVAAVAGRELPVALLEGVAQLSAEALRVALDDLQAGEFLLEVVPESGQPGASLAFRHALTRDAAYGSLLTEARRGLHRELAEVLAERFADRVQAQPEVLAHHYAEAGLAAEAIPLWQQAAQRAIGRAAHVDALAHLERGLKLLRQLPEGSNRDERELEFQAMRAAVLQIVKGYGTRDVASPLQRVRELCRRLDRTPSLFTEWTNLLVAGQLNATRGLAEDLLKSKGGKSKTAATQAHTALALTLLQKGEPRPALEHAMAVIEDYDADSHAYLSFFQVHDLGMMCLLYAAHSHWALGRPDQAKHCSTQAIALASRLAHPINLGMTLYMSAWCQSCCRDVETTDQLATRAVQLSTKHGFPVWEAGGVILQGWAQLQRGATAAGAERLEQGLEMWLATGARLGMPGYRALEAAAHRAMDRPERGLEAVEKGLAVAAAQDEHYFESELYRERGELLLLRGDREQAHGAFEEARRLARDQCALSLELRAALSLGRFLVSEGQGGEARELVGPIYARFSEGLDTADLQDAKAFLDQLAETEVEPEEDAALVT